ncbi:S-adenosyl-L-methionine-dependentmethyltransferases superfamily protein [Striga asiatica]|uniref:Methyltransferase n=1 Tax=Striga asiatica TaxID=4170 RepID=A0A5A7PS25_STRAF|nr:S-adenosyl-L-methionine-dependentmethyltransferases superfamily protein [Striga asiatica]
MAKEYNGSPKPHHLNMKRKRLTYILAVSGLCIIFYILGAWQGRSPIQSTQTDFSSSKVNCENENENIKTHLPQSSSSATSSIIPDQLDFETHHQLAVNSSDSTEKFRPCDPKFTEYTPCEDQQRGRKFDRDMLKYRERHCPTKDELLRCLIPAPPNYKSPFKWPQSRDYAWYSNIPHKELSIEKAVQNWIQVEGDRFRFPGGGTMFPRGADAYIDDISALIPLTDGSIRTAVDTGCGVASWGAYLLKRDIIAMSFAPRDTHEAQVWFALERGVPAMIGIMGSRRLPYPARAFDMAHCSRCLIPWFDHGGLYLAEVDRILRPGGYWILSGPPIRWEKYWRGWERTKEDLKQEQDSIEDVAKRLCWKKVVQKGDLAIWQKPINHVECLDTKTSYPEPPICKSDNADAAWYKDLENCITPLPEVSSASEVAGGPLKKWPERAFAVPPRISNGLVKGVTAKQFQEDNELWKNRVSYYKKLVSQLSRGMYRNVMDMNANLGGFAAAMMKYPVWVMNVVPSTHETLGVIYERGFIGTYMDWCEAFSTYPRTYDLIHAGGVFSLYQDSECADRKLWKPRPIRILMFIELSVSVLPGTQNQGHSKAADVIAVHVSLSNHLSQAVAVGVGLHVESQAFHIEIEKQIFGELTAQFIFQSNQEM